MPLDTKVRIKLLRVSVLVFLLVVSGCDGWAHMSRASVWADGWVGMDWSRRVRL